MDSNLHKRALQDKCTSNKIVTGDILSHFKTKNISSDNAIFLNTDTAETKSPTLIVNNYKFYGFPINFLKHYITYGVIIYKTIMIICKLMTVYCSVNNKQYIHFI